jgi:hypothetical protein
MFFVELPIPKYEAIKGSGLKYDQYIVTSILMLFVSAGFAGCSEESQIQSTPRASEFKCKSSQSEQSKTQNSNTSQTEEPENQNRSQDTLRGGQNLLDGGFSLTTPTYESEIKDIFKAYCISCHSGSQPPDLTDWNEIADRMDDIESEIESNSMPPVDEIEEEDIQFLEDWFLADSPRGGDGSSTTDSGSNTQDNKQSSGTESKQTSDSENSNSNCE